MKVTCAKPVSVVNIHNFLAFCDDILFVDLFVPNMCRIFCSE